MNRLQSDLYKINWYDIAKGFIVAFLAIFVSTVAVTINDGALPTVPELKAAAMAGFAAGVGYLLKNFLTNSQGALGTKTTSNGQIQ